MAEPPDLLNNQHPIALRLGRIAENVLDFHEKVASATTEDELDALENHMKKYPRACAAKLRIAPTLLNKVLPNRSFVAHKTLNETRPTKNITAKELQKMNLTDAQLKKLAGMAGVADATDAEIVGGEDAK